VRVELSSVGRTVLRVRDDGCGFKLGDVVRGQGCNGALELNTQLPDLGYTARAGDFALFFLVLSD
jgi:glucose-6-phosphate-specific signal transduction histidine kinase